MFSGKFECVAAVLSGQRGHFLEIAVHRTSEAKVQQFRVEGESILSRDDGWYYRRTRLPR